MQGTRFSQMMSTLPREEQDRIMEEMTEEQWDNEWMKDRLFMEEMPEEQWNREWKRDPVPKYHDEEPITDEESESEVSSLSEFPIRASSFGERMAMLTEKEQKYVMKRMPEDQLDYNHELELYDEHVGSEVSDEVWLRNIRLDIEHWRFTDKWDTDDKLYYSKLVEIQ